MRTCSRPTITPAYCAVLLRLYLCLYLWECCWATHGPVVTRSFYLIMRRSKAPLLYLRVSDKDRSQPSRPASRNRYAHISHIKEIFTYHGHGHGHGIFIYYANIIGEQNRRSQTMFNIAQNPRCTSSQPRIVYGCVRLLARRYTGKSSHAHVYAMTQSSHTQALERTRNHSYAHHVVTDSQHFCFTPTNKSV